MRILVDDSAAFNQGAGIGRYARNIVPALARALPEADFRLLYAPERAGPPPFGDEALAAFPDPARVTVRRAPFSRRRADQLWFRARLPLPMQLFAGRGDLLYSPDFTAPPALGAPRVMTIHDLAFLVCPAHTPEALRAYLTATVPRQVAAAAAVLAVSETTKRDLMEYLDVLEERIVVVPNGVDDRFFNASPLSKEERDKLGVPERYLLSVGTIEPRKNHQTLFAALRQSETDVDVPLVVAGRRGWSEEPILEAAADLRRAGRVIFVDYMPEVLLPGLYAGAAALVYPSWYEGFGLPVLEALAVGIPVVASTAPALREVAGEMALYADPADPAAIAAAIVRALAPAQSAESARTARRQRARCFTWDRAGQELARVLSEVMGRTNRAQAPR